MKSDCNNRYCNFSWQAIFDKKALNIIYQLSHSNIMELQGVTLLGPYSAVCFHIMPLMTCEYNFS